MTPLLIQAILLSAGLDPLVARLENAEYLTGSFVQTDYWALTLDSEDSRGTLHLSHPNLFLLQYDEPEGKVMGCSGDTVFTVDPDFMEILVYSGTPTGFLHLLTSASSDSAAVSVQESGDSVTVTLSGDLEGGMVRMEAAYTLTDSLPYMFSTVDHNGNTTSWQLMDLRETNPPEGLYEVPSLPGYSIVDAGTL